MAEEKNDRKAEEIQENSVPEESNTETAGKETEEQISNERSSKSGGFGKVVLILFVLVVAGLVGIPQTREMILEKYRQFSSAAENGTEEVVIAEEPVVEEVVEPEEIVNRLEQLENAREFENAEVVIASAEPPQPSVMTDTAYVALANQQKALLSEIERLRAQLDQVRVNSEREINRLREALPNMRRLEERFSAVYAREDGMEQRLVQENIKINRLEKNKADASSVLSLMTRMDAAEQKLRVSNVEKERAVALLLAVYQLREAALSGNGFSTEQQSALALADAFPRIAGYLRSLSGNADQGIQTKTALLRSFGTYADQAVLAESLSPKTDWFHKALNSLKTLVVIRRTDVIENDQSTQSVLARAGLAVRDEDLGEAVLILKDLKGTAADTMRGWEQNAERYVTVKKTINETISAVLGVVYAEQLKGE